MTTQVNVKPTHAKGFFSAMHLVMSAKVLSSPVALATTIEGTEKRFFERREVRARMSMEMTFTKV
jgi:hypothetical protein